MYKMTVDFPNLSKGAEVQIDGLGIFENGYEHPIADDLAQDYRTHHSHIVEELDEGGEVISRTVEQGPTLLQAFSGHESITIKSTKTRRPPKDDGDQPDTNGDDDTPEGGAS